MSKIYIRTATIEDIPSIQAMQDKAIVDYGHACENVFFPRSKNYRRQVLEEGGELYLACDSCTHVVVGSMIGENAKDDTAFAKAVNAQIQAGGELMVPGRRKVVSAAIVDKYYLGQDIWRLMMRYAADCAREQKICDLSFASALAHAKICSRALAMGFYVTGVARHRIMNVKGIILSAGSQYVTRQTTTHTASYCIGNSIDFELETYLDAGFIGVALDPVQNRIVLAEIDQASAYSSPNQLGELRI